ncbi:MAG: redox-regulated ATPase YchF [Dehalococcoidia bacterium]
MAIGIIGMPRTGKTSIFNAVTRGNAETAGFRTAGAQPNVGIAKVPDPRLDALAEISKPKKIVPAEIEYVDIPAAPEGMGKTKGIGGEYLNILQRCEALLMVCRSFENPAVPHVEDTIDPYRDAESLEMELNFSDLAILERREQRLTSQLRSAKATERDALTREKDLIAKIREGLEQDIPLRQQEIPPEAMPILENFQLLSAKPLMVVFNIGEDDIARTTEIEAELAERLARPNVAVAALCGKLEMELAQMDPEEEAEFRASLDAGEPGLDRMVRLSYGLLGLISFLTTGEDETRAWTIHKGMTAVEASGKIHSDIARGFIRAEIVSFDDLVKTRSWAEARKRALLRSEGKQYVMQDGDVVNYLFNV